VAILQSAYIPWKGYVDIIGLSDEFILYDDAQFSKNDWRNRNRIRTARGLAWLTIPVRTAGRLGQPIRDVEIADGGWSRRHWQAIQTHYRGARHFDELAPALAELYRQTGTERSLSRVNEIWLRAICDWLGLTTRITRSMDYELRGDRVDRLVDLCEQLGATEYLTGPSARAYLDEERFARRRIRVVWMDYSGYPEYPQLHAGFVAEVSILDLLLNEGIAGARTHLRSTRRPAAERGGDRGPGC
jgi:hypothetical protein